MNKENKGTVYQELNQFLNLDGFSAQNKDQAPEQKQKIIIKGNSPEEIKRKGLELEQKRELQNKFFRTSDRGFQKALQYEAARLPAYIDFEGMEYYPIISSALDLFMEEATTIGMEGKMLTINSNKERIKSLLETFFYDIVNVNINLPFWTRNMPIKYDSMIPLLDGSEIKIIELSERLKNNPNEEIWTYSIQDNTNKIVAGKIVWCDLTRKDSDILKVTFDDGTYVETTPDHEYMLRTGKYVRADELKSGMSLMPYYTLTSSVSYNEMVYDPSTNDYTLTNNIIPNELINSDNIEHNENTILNHKVVSVEKLSEKYDVYCMEVVGKNNEQDRHNFPVCSKDQNGNYTRNGVFLSNCKYGDNFVHLYGEKSKGITHVRQLVNYEIERFDRIQNGKPVVKFKERMTGDEFNTFEIAHFRLLGDDKYLPYGSSLLNKIRRSFRQLCLDSETNIWTPNGNVKIKDIKVGDTVFSYDYTANKTVTTTVKNVIKTGEKERFAIRTRHRELMLTDDHPLLTVDDNGNYSYKNIKEVTNEKLILPTIIEGNSSFKIKLNSEKYHVVLNHQGLLKIKEIPSIGIINKLKELKCKTSIKNLHSFIKGYNRSIIYDDYIKLTKTFNLTLDDIDLHYFNSRKIAIVDKNLEFTVDSKFSELFGFMLGDGWINHKTKSLGFALGIYEDENQYYLNLFKSFGDFKYYLKTAEIGSGSGGIVEFHSTEFIDIFSQLGFHTGAFNKTIPDWIFSSSYENKIKFIKGIFDADGCDSNHIYSSSNLELINGLRTLAQTCNIKVGRVLSNKINSIYKSKLLTVEVNRKPSYTLYIHLSNLNETKSNEEKIISKNSVGVGEVWDIEVENDLHNFIAEGVVVHNCMAEDAMLTYRIIRAGEKKVFKIDVGNIDEDDIEDYIYKVANKFKKVSQVSQNDGQIDYRFNILGNDEDYFIPVRNANTQTGIDTLPGAENLDKISDIEYLRDNLITGLGIPKPFLSFQDAAGAGKNMAQYDIRFAKKIARIQQSMVQELNKMAIIHLYLLGYTAEDLTDFTLSLTNPSIQSDLLKSELYREKAQTYAELTRADNGIAAMSHTTAKRVIFNMSDKAIVDDLKQQKMEKVVMQELQDSPVVIKKSGLFADIDKRFGEPIEGMPIEAGSGSTGENISGSTPIIQAGEVGAPVGGELPPAGGELPPAGGELPALKEDSESYYETIVDKLVYGDVKNLSNAKHFNKKIIIENTIINDKLNNNASTMINEIDNILKTTESFNRNSSTIDVDDINIENIDEIEVN